MGWAGLISPAPLNLQPRLPPNPRAAGFSFLRHCPSGRGRLKLVAGMPVESFIQTGERTVMSYFIKPLNDQITKAWREK
jgi:hypothetical protein